MENGGKTCNLAIASALCEACRPAGGPLDMLDRHAMALAGIRACIDNLDLGGKSGGATLEELVDAMAANAADQIRCVADDALSSVTDAERTGFAEKLALRLVNRGNNSVVANVFSGDKLSRMNFSLLEERDMGNRDEYRIMPTPECVSLFFGLESYSMESQAAIRKRIITYQIETGQFDQAEGQIEETILLAKQILSDFARVKRIMDRDLGSLEWGEHVEPVIRMFVDQGKENADWASEIRETVDNAEITEAKADSAIRIRRKAEECGMLFRRILKEAIPLGDLFDKYHSRNLTKDSAKASLVDIEKDIIDPFLRLTVAETDGLSGFLWSVFPGKSRVSVPDIEGLLYACMKAPAGDAGILVEEDPVLVELSVASNPVMSKEVRKEAADFFVGAILSHDEIRLSEMVGKAMDDGLGPAAIDLVMKRVGQRWTDSKLKDRSVEKIDGPLFEAGDHMATDYVIKRTKR